MNRFDVRIENTKNKIQKLEQKLARIKTALETGKNPYCYEERDVRITTSDLNHANATLAELTEKKMADERMEQIPAIEEFLNAWKLKAIEWHEHDFAKLQNYLAEYRSKKEEFRQWRIEQFQNEYIRNKEMFEKEKELGLDYETHQKKLRIGFNSISIRLLDFRQNWKPELERLMENEKNAKRRNLIERVKKVVGEITDATGLYIGQNAEINGVVIGTKNSAKVETITAGGYNIQCFHYRVLVHELNR